MGGGGGKAGRLWTIAIAGGTIVARPGRASGRRRVLLVETMAASSNGTPLWFHGPLGGGEATEALLEAGAADGGSS